jgi:ribosomal protein L13
VATILRGKHKRRLRCTQPWRLRRRRQCGEDAVTRNRLDEKIYYRHSSTPAAGRETLRQALQKHPERVMSAR